MDPTQCYLEMLTALRAGDLTTGRQRALALRNWLDRGGFSPPGFHPTEVRDRLAGVLLRTAGLADTEDETP